MWLHDLMLGISSAHPLPLRVNALLDAATKAGLGVGRTRDGVMAVLRDQSSAIVRQWQMRNLISTEQPSGTAIPSHIVDMLVEQQRDCKEMRLVSISFLFASFVLIP
jgi:hypothetical protein